MNEANQYIQSVQKIITKRGDKSFISSCVFISPSVALTAAHSVEGSDSVSCIGFKAISVTIHPDYDPTKSNFLNDLAIVEFSSDVSSYVSLSEDLVGPVFYRVGFGSREGENLRASFMVHLREACEKYNKFYDLSSAVGDSGGGIFNSNKKLVGIHSTKEGTETYTINLEYFMDWITPYINKSHQVLHQAI
jgi:hypothetical protein